MRTPRLRPLIAATLAMAMVLAACGDGDTADTDDTGNDEAAVEEEEEDAPLALDDEPEAEEEEEVAEEEEEVAEEEFDLVAAVDTYASTIPDGWMFERDVDAFKEALAVEGAVLIDVREVGEYAEGHIPGAVNIPIRELGANLDAIPTDQPVWIYCASGWRAGMATSSLRLMGYTNVQAYAPGAAGWTAAGEELVNEGNELGSFGEPEALQPELVEAVDTFLATIPEGFYANSLEAVQEATDAGAVLIDAREPGEYEEGFILDALSVPVRTTASTDVEVPTDTNAIVYCQSGFRAALTMPMYHVLGFTNVQGFPGSFGAWVEAGEAVTS